MWTTAATFFYGLIFVDFPPAAARHAWLATHVIAACCRAARASAVPPRAAGARSSVDAAGDADRSRRLGRRLSWRAMRVDVVLSLRRTRPSCRSEPQRCVRSPMPRNLKRESIGIRAPTRVYVVLADGTDLDCCSIRKRLTAGQTPVPAAASSYVVPPSSASQARPRSYCAWDFSVAAVRISLEQRPIQSGFRPGSFAPFANRLAGAPHTTHDVLRFDPTSPQPTDSAFRAGSSLRRPRGTPPYLLRRTTFDVAHNPACRPVDPRQNLTAAARQSLTLRKSVPEFFTGCRSPRVSCAARRRRFFSRLALSLLFALVPTDRLSPRGRERIRRSRGRARSLSPRSRS